MTKEITISWCTEDVIGEHPHLTEAQAEEVLEFVKESHDATIGINWDVIDNAVDTLGYGEG